MKITLLISAFLCIASFNSAQAKTLYSSQASHSDDSEWFFLLGTSKGNYLLSSTMLDLKKAHWNGHGNPPLSIGDATLIAANTMKIPSDGSMALKTVELRVAQSKQKNELWFYLITFTEYPYQFDGATAHIVVLMNGDALVAHSPRK